ncbi:MAG: hypothetical protein HYY14_02730 [Candidatus Omnitrophica bacterium]|nr:hypothetical protein [Candidatus Omnitrophota bacterium]
MSKVQDMLYRALNERYGKMYGVSNDVEVLRSEISEMERRLKKTRNELAQEEWVRSQLEREAENLMRGLSQQEISARESGFGKRDTQYAERSTQYDRAR